MLRFSPRRPILTVILRGVRFLHRPLTEFAHIPNWLALSRKSFLIRRDYLNAIRADESRCGWVLRCILQRSTQRFLYRGK